MSSQAKGKSVEAATKLAQLIEVLTGHHNTVHLLGHSLGVRVCLGALTLLPRPIGTHTHYCIIYCIKCTLQYALAAHPVIRL